MSRPRRKPDYEAYKKACAKAAEQEDIPNLLDESDPYDVFEEMRAAFDSGEGAGDFILRIFAEDLAQRELDEEQYHESLGHEFDECS